MKAIITNYCSKTRNKITYACNESREKLIDFCSCKRFSKPFMKEAKGRVQENIACFRFHYLILDIVIALAFGWPLFITIVPVCVFLLLAKHTIIEKSKFYQLCILTSAVLMISLYLHLGLTLKISVLALSLTLLHSMYHDFPTPIHNEP